MPNFLIDEDTELLAAEFVLGTLDAEERANAHSLLRVDHGFIAMVRIWERRLSELHLMVEPVEPDAKIYDRIKAKLAETPQGDGPASVRLPVETPSTPPVAPLPAADATAQDSAPTPVTEPVTQTIATEPGASPPPVETVEASASTAESTPTTPETETAVTEPKSEEAAETTSKADTPAVADAPAADAETKIETTPTPEPAAEAGASTPEVRLPEAIVRSERVPQVEKVTIPLPQEPPKILRRQPEPAPRRDAALGIKRSRGRWRAFGVLLFLLVAALGGLVAAWKFVPDQVPPALRPAQLMSSLGIDGPSPPRVRPTRPAATFDE
jgi:hypothetical protein